MRRALPLLLLLVGLGSLPAAAEPRDPPEEGWEAETVPEGLRSGMPAADVIQRLGPPQHVARQVLYGRWVEQWTYDKPPAVRIVFDWRKGQEKQIQTVQPLSTPGR
jgi:hypothetical protein